jgi:2-hydroxychromene-2-carboxylate isomerase
MARLDFFYDYGSPYSYLADTRLASLRRRTGCEIAYRPMLLGGVFKATGNRSPAFESVEAKRAYGSREMARWVAHLVVPFQFNPHFPINTLNLMRAAHAAQQLDVFDGFHAAIFPAMWARGENLGDPEVCTRVLNEADVDAQALFAAATTDDAKRALRETTEEAIERGAFGAPTFVVGDEMFFGNDRLDFVERALGSEEAT